MSKVFGISEWVCSEMGYTLWKFNIANYGKSPFLMGKSTINGDFP